MPDRLKEKVAIVTGAGSSGPGVGTGKAISVLFAREGARLLLADVSKERAAETLEQVREAGAEADTVTADVSSEAGCREVVRAAVDRFGRLDVLVNNVGIVAGGSITDLSEEDWHRVLDVNLGSMVWMTKHAIPAMVAAGGGSIVNLSSIAAARGSGSVPYAASKAGVEGLTRDVAVTHGPEGIRVNCILPGHIYTPMVASMSDEDRELRRRIGALETEGTAWDVAWAAVFLASDESRWITGVSLPVDAGNLASMAIVPLQRMRRD
jgi:NAD(P)-dependent dehydrogenase (short-subunit alcohol dehydrogenase family)